MKDDLKLMRKKAAFIPVAALVVASSLCLCGCLTWDYGDGISLNDQIESGTIELEEFDKLDIDVSSYDVILKRGDRFSIEYKAAKGRVPVVSQKEDKVSVTQPTKLSISINPGVVTGDTGYTITVPDDRIIKLDVASVSGDIMTDHVNIAGEVDTISGDVFITDTQGGKLEIETTSGEISTDKISNEKSIFNSTSGDITLMRINSDDISCDTTSGDITVNNSEATDITCTSTSGEVVIELIGEPDDFSYDIGSTSGDITVNDESVEEEHKKDNDKGGRIVVNTMSSDIVVNVK